MTDLVESRIAFAAMAWVPVAEGARQKVREKDGKRARLLELTQAFVECE